jgi:hypothetical protein
MSAAEAIYQEQESAVRDLIRRIENKEEYLSYSSLREFAISPRHFLRYKLRQKEQTPAMVFGSLVDCMILTEDQVEARFAVAPDVDRRTKDGKAKWEEFIQQPKKSGTRCTGMTRVPSYWNRQTIRNYLSNTNGKAGSGAASLMPTVLRSAGI